MLRLIKLVGLLIVIFFSKTLCEEVLFGFENDSNNRLKTNCDSSLTSTGQVIDVNDLNVPKPNGTDTVFYSINGNGCFETDLLYLYNYIKLKINYYAFDQYNQIIIRIKSMDNEIIYQKNVTLLTVNQWDTYETYFKMRKKSVPYKVSNS